MATAAVLLINPEMMEMVKRKINNVNHFHFPPIFTKLSTKTSKKPVFTKALLIIKIEPIVITAGLLNPLMASSQLIILNKRSNPTAPKAVTSNGNISKIKNITITVITNNNIKILKVIFMFPVIN